MKKIKILVFIALVSIAIFIYINYEMNNNKIYQLSGSEANEQKNSSVDNPITTSLEIALNKDIKNDLISNDGENSNFRKNDFSDINEWHSNKIAHEGFNTSDYGNYDEDTLLKLVHDGDVLAMKALWLLYLNKDSNDPDFLQSLENQKVLVDLSVIYGDRELFSNIRGFVDAQQLLSNPMLNTNQRHEVAIEYLAYTEFMGMRGDLGSKYENTISLFNLYPKLYSKDNKQLHLTVDDKLKILNRAQEIYDLYEMQRIGLNLGEFDNHIPDGVAKQFDLQKENYMNTLGTSAF